MQQPWSVTEGWVRRSRAAARFELQRVRESAAYQTGLALLSWLRSPLSPTCWRDLVLAWRRPSELVLDNWAIRQFPPIPEAAPQWVSASVEASWLEAYELRRGLAMALGTVLRCRGWQRALAEARTRWKTHYAPPSLPPLTPRMIVSSTPAPVSVTSPAWLSKWLAFETWPGIPGQHLLCCEADHIEGPDGALVWIVTETQSPRRTRALDTASGVFAISPEQQTLWSRCLGRDVGLAPAGVQPLCHNPIGWWTKATVRSEELPSPWSGLVEAARGGGIDSADDRVRLGRMRQTLRHQTLAHSLRRLAGVPDPPLPRVSVVVTTCRPIFLESLLGHLEKQTYSARELVLVAHGRDFQRRAVEERLRQCSFSTRLLIAPASTPLGACMHLGLSQTEGDVICKMDDDDWYGARLLEDLMMGFDYTRAGLVGKSTFAVRFENDDSMYLLNPGFEFRYGPPNCGAALAARREVFEALSFRPVRVGEDTRFIEDCMVRSIPALCESRFGYVYRRFEQRHHTWKPHRPLLEYFDHDPLPAGLSVEAFDA